MGDGVKRIVLAARRSPGVWAMRFWKTPRDPLVYLGIAAVIVGISLNYLWLPLRAAQYPPINEGEPVGFFSQALKDVLNRVQYGKPPLAERQATLLGPARELLAVLHLAVRPRLGPAARGVATALFTVLGAERPLGALEARPPRRPRRRWRCSARSRSGSSST